MIDSKWRGTFQSQVMDRLLKIPFIAKLKPSAISFMSLITGLFVPISLYLNLTWTALIFLALSGFLDTLDGSVARLTKKVSNRGAALDITFDRVVEMGVIFGLYFVDPKIRALGALLMLGSTLFCITTFLVVGIFTLNGSAKSFHYSPGMIERTEAFLFFSALIAFPAAFYPLAIAFTTLVTLTGALRLGQFIKDSS